MASNLGFAQWEAELLAKILSIPVHWVITKGFV